MPYSFLSRESAVRPKFISPVSQVAITVILASFQLLGSLVWLIAIRPGIRHFHPTRGEVVLKCHVEDHWFLISLCYDVFLIVTCTVYAVRTRKVPENFNEAKFIGFTMYTTCIIWLAFVPIYFGTGSDFQVRNSYKALFNNFAQSVRVVTVKFRVQPPRGQTITWDRKTILFLKEHTVKFHV